MSANWWDAYPRADQQPAPQTAQGANWWDQYPVAESANSPRAYNPFASDERSLPPLPGEQVVETFDRSAPTQRPSYLQSLGEALQAPATVAQPRNFVERLGNVPVIGPAYGLVEAGATMASSMVAPAIAGVEGAITGRTPTNDDIARFTYEPRTQPGRAYLGIAGAALAPVADLAEETGADIALLPLAGETQAMRAAQQHRAGARAHKQQAKEAERLATPTVEELSEAAREAYAQAKQAGAVVRPESYARMASGMRESLREQGFNPRLHPKAAAVLDEIEAAQGQPMSFQELEILRRQALAAERSIEADERRIASLIVDRLDDYSDTLLARPQDALAGDARTAVEATKRARNLYARSRKAQEITELIERADIRASQFSGSGRENALRTEFRQLAMNPKRMRRFSKEEQAAIKEVAFGTKTSNLLRQIGKLAPTGGLSQWLSIGATMINPMAAIIPAAGGAARLGATHMTQGAASRAQALMRRGPAPSPEELGASIREATPSAISGELMPREPQQPAALPFRPAPEPAPIVVDAMGRAGSAADMAAFQTEMGLAGLRGVRQPRAEPVPGQNLFSQLAREQQIDRAGAAFEAERAAAAARGGIEVQELPALEIVLESQPAAAAATPTTREIRNALARLAEPVKEAAAEPMRAAPMRVAAKSAVATRSERRPKNALAQLAPGAARTVAEIEADLKKLDARAQRIPADEPFDSPRMRAIEDEYNRLREELKAARARLSQQEKALDKRKMMPSPADEFRTPLASMTDASEAGEMARILAQNIDVHRYPIQSSKNFEDIMRGIARDMKVVRRNWGGDTSAVYEIQSPKGGVAYAVVNKDGTVELDISKFSEGMEGSAIYQAVGDFAHNNGLKFIGDPEGLSPIAQIRRTLNMLASAMRHGTTRHLAPHPLQQSPQVKAARPLQWREGDDAFNIREMADTLVETYGRLVPEIKGIRYNGRTKRFEDGAGNVVTDRDFGRMARHARKATLETSDDARRGLGRTPPIGRGSLKAVAFLQSGVRSLHGKSVAGAGGGGAKRNFAAHKALEGILPAAGAAAIGYQLHSEPANGFSRLAEGI